VKDYALGAASTVSMVACAYHGYKRNEKSGSPILWALGWGVLGSVFFFITPVVALAEGFAKPAKK
jgi:hypothetical protein